MFTNNDKEHIKLLYDKFLKVNIYIKTAIEQNDIETIQNIFSTKNQLIKQIHTFEKIHHKEIKKDKELLSIKLNLIEKEKENIKLLENSKEKIMKEFLKISKVKNLHKAYEPSLNEVRSTFDIKDEDME